MKDLPVRPARGAIVMLAAIAILSALALSSPWHPEHRPGPPRVLEAAWGAGVLRAGAAAVPFDLPAGVPIGGFARLRYGSEGVRDPVGARALILAEPCCKIALVSVEILLVPDALEEAVLARLSDLDLTGLVLAATHTHAGPGGYWQHGLGERIATGAYDPHLRDLVAGTIAEAIRSAHAGLAPARVSVARAVEPDLARSRSGGIEDARLTVVRVDREGGVPLAELVVFPAHPTILGSQNRRISGDWPGRLVARGRHGLRLFFQGALGDQSVEGPTSTPEEFGDALSARVDALAAGAADAAPSLAWAAVEVELPSPRPGALPAVLRPAARNVMHRAFPPTARVEAVRVGDLVLVAVPAEPVASVAARWRGSFPPGAEIVSLAGAYLGYVEEPERMARGEGETVRTYLGPDLAARLGEGAKLAVDAVMRPPAVPARGG